MCSRVDDDDDYSSSLISIPFDNKYQIYFSLKVDDGTGTRQGDIVVLVYQDRSSSSCSFRFQF